MLAFFFSFYRNFSLFCWDIVARYLEETELNVKEEAQRLFYACFALCSIINDMLQIHTLSCMFLESPF